MSAQVPANCNACRDRDLLEPAISMAFQPIVDVRERQVFAYEALVRGPSDEPAGEVIARFGETDPYAFDQACRVKAISLASRLGLVDSGALLSINFLPNAVYRPETCIQTTLRAAREADLPTNRLMFEVTEVEKVRDHAHLRNIIDYYQSMGFTTAIDDFGSGYAGLNLLAAFQPDILKLDMELIRGIDQNAVTQAVVVGIVRIATDLGIRLIAEGVETEDEFRYLQDIGITLFQGYLFARPQFGALPAVAWPADFSTRSARK